MSLYYPPIFSLQIFFAYFGEICLENYGLVELISLRNLKSAPRMMAGDEFQILSNHKFSKDIIPLGVGLNCTYTINLLSS